MIKGINESIFVIMSAGTTHNCAVTALGGENDIEYSNKYKLDLTCWGSNDQEETDVPEYIRQADIKFVESGFSHSCIIGKEKYMDQVDCWGGDLMNQTQVPDQINKNSLLLPDYEDNNNNIFTRIKIKQMSAGVGHTCTLDKLGRVICWGFNQFGQIEIPEYEMDTKDEDEERGRNGNRSGEIQNRDVLSVAAGAGHTCIVDQMENVVCWGLNDMGQCDAPFLFA